MTTMTSGVSVGAVVAVSVASVIFSVDSVAVDEAVFSTAMVVGVSGGFSLVAEGRGKEVAVAMGWRVVAVEPGLGMLGHVSADDEPSGAGKIDRLCATAEATSLRARSVGLVTCAQSFHWFNPPFALAEFARILKPGGALVLVWNNRDLRDPFVSQFEELVGKWNPSYRREYRRQDWDAKVADAGGFTPLTGTTIESVWEMDQEDFVGFTRRVSYIRNVLSRQDRPTFEGELRQLLRSHFSRSACEVSLVTKIWWAMQRTDE